MAVPELPSAIAHGSLLHGLLTLLGMRDRRPERFERAAVAWHARWALDAPAIDLAQSRAVLAALERFQTADPATAAMELRRQCGQCGLDDLAEVLDDWAASHPPAPST